MNFAVFSFIILLCFLYLCVKSNAKRNWDFEMLNFKMESSDDNLVNVTSKIENGELGRQSFSAFVDWKYDTDENTMINMKIYSCQSGRERDFHEIPYSIPNISLYEFLSQYYMNIFYPEYSSCSNLPQFDKFVPPWNKTLYIFTECRPEGKTMPEILSRGYYRVVLTISGQAEVVVQLDGKVTPNGLIS